MSKELENAALDWHVTRRFGEADPNSQSYAHAAWDIKNAIEGNPTRLKEIVQEYQAHLGQKLGIRPAAEREL